MPYLEREEKGWDPKYDGRQVEEATNSQSYDGEDEEAVWWWVLAGNCGSQGSCDQWLHWSLHGSGMGALTVFAAMHGSETFCEVEPSQRLDVIYCE